MEGHLVFSDGWVQATGFLPRQEMNVSFLSSIAGRSAAAAAARASWLFFCLFSDSSFRLSVASSVFRPMSYLG